MTTHPRRRTEDRSGFTLVELIVTLVLMLVLLSLAAPVMRRMVDSYRTQAATSQIATDLAYTRTLAIQNGRQASLRRTGASTYVITVDTSTTNAAVSAQKLVRTVNLARDVNTVTIGPDPLRVSFDSRGFATAGIGDITITRPGGMVDTLKVQALGRIRRAN